jgi:hypothetical protein
MKRTARWRSKRGFGKRASTIAILSSLLAFGSLLAAPSPEISYIERWSVNGTNGVLVHFDTDANKTYTLQAADKLGTNAVWTNLYSAPNLPFTGHYIVPDIRPGNHFYRLHVTK